MNYFVGSILLLSCSAAFANDTVCAGKKTYYRYLQADSGVSRTPATWSIRAELNGGNVVDYSVNADAMPAYTVDLSSERAIWSNNNRLDSDSIYSVRKILLT